MVLVKVSHKYLRQVELAILDAAFQAWQSLGNTSPIDDSGAPEELATCLSVVCPLDLPRATELLGADELASGSSREMSGYCDLLTGLSHPEPHISASAIEKLLPCCAPGNARVQKILSAVGCMIGGGPGEVPGLDRQSSFIAAAEFFVDAGDASAGARLLSKGSWDFPRSYRTAAMALMLTPHLRAARVAWEMGSGMSEEVSASHCAAFDYLEGKGSPSRFRAMHHAAERGFALPLVVSSAALELGVGVDQDGPLASAYMSLAKGLPSSSAVLLSEIRAKMNGGLPLNCEKRPAPRNATEIMMNWASKHVSDPIHRTAALEWSRIRLAARRPRSPNAYPLGPKNWKKSLE